MPAGSPRQKEAAKPSVQKKPVVKSLTLKKQVSKTSARNSSEKSILGKRKKAPTSVSSLAKKFSKVSVKAKKKLNTS